MITCPLCQKEVLYNPGYVQAQGLTVNLEHETLEDDRTDDFYCPTFVPLFRGHSVSHYTRRTLHGCWPEYQLVAPPFQLIWHEGKNDLNIFNNLQRGAWPNQPWKSYQHMTFPDVIRLAKQLHTFRAFV